jgi:hypothetical protein
MTSDLQARHQQYASPAPIEGPADDRDRSELAGLITAGVMTFLLSGDLRLATRATRLLISDDGSPSVAGPARARRAHSVWHRRR